LTEKFQELVEKIEVFLFRNDGVCILSKTKRSPELFTSMLAAIEAFTHTVSGLGAEEVTMGDNRINYSRNGDIVCAVITPESFDPHIGNAISKSIADIFVSKYGSYLAFWKGNLDDFSDFSTEIDDIIHSVLSSFGEKIVSSHIVSVHELIRMYGEDVSQILYSIIMNIPIVIYGDRKKVEGIINQLSNFFIKDAPNLSWVEPELVNELIKSHDFVIIGSSVPPTDTTNVLILSTNKVENKLTENKYLQKIANVLLENLDDWNDEEAHNFLSMKKAEFFKCVELAEELISKYNFSVEELSKILEISEDMLFLVYAVAKRNIESSQ